MKDPEVWRKRMVHRYFKKAARHIDTAFETVGLNFVAEGVRYGVTIILALIILLQVMKIVCT
jgi:hypothetical protein